jgi:PKD repeat protein
MAKKALEIAKPLVIIGSTLALLFLFGCESPSPYSPIACIKADPTIGYTPLTVSFDASCSSAEGVSPPPEGMFSYGWDFDDDSAAAHGMTVEHITVLPAE